MTQHRDEVYLLHMLDHAQMAVQLSEGKGRGDLDTEPLLRYSLLHLVCVLGEAANRVSDAGKAKYHHLEWRDIVSMRNMLIHGYDVVDLDILWKTITEDLPATIHALREALSKKDDL